MARQTRSQKNIQVHNNNGKGLHQENTEVFDDNLLPDASEIKALSEIDPEILNWLKLRAEKEQDFRHKIFSDRTKILKYDVEGEMRLNYLGMTYAFLIIVLGMCFSGLLIYWEHIITGSIFSGFTIIYAATLFYKKRSSTLPPPPKREK
ncbi:hypothetical protein [Flavobacterium litorale]|uniref:DUF2335 domain-containing protein n=1 Tax=Flavobacterium litorale TaxID=2856519 RepID=A0ABX8V7V7_9FLAO|nr:hypothetical protein [Flavobacterium litorale]QYJ68917.1 hypothetical protein K1I41_03265 [Flavobacterium litorale]